MENNGNVSSTLSTPAYAYAGGALPQAQTTASTAEQSTVIVTSVLTQTQTVRSTLVVTESTVIASEPATLQTTTTQTWATALETALSSDREEHTTPHTAEHWAGVLGHLSAHTSVSSPVSDSASFQVVSTSTSSSTLSIVTSSSSSRVISTSITQHVSTQHVSTTPLDSPTSSPTTSPFTVILGPIPTPDSTGHTTHDPINVGAIVGGAVGGAALLALGVIACCLFFRRKGHRVLLRQQTSRQGLLSPSPSSPTRGLRNREISEPTLPIAQPIPSAPVFPARKYSDSVASHPVSAVPIRDVPLLWSLVHAENDHGPENPFADPEDSPTAPSIETSAQSHAASASSLLESASQQWSYEDTYHRSESSLMPPSDTNTANNANTTKAGIANEAHHSKSALTMNAYGTRVRSDPWDLERSLAFLQK